MSLHEYVLFDPLFSDTDAVGMVRLCERFRRYGMYSAENDGGSEIGDGLTQRHDAVLNYLKAGGMRGAGESVSVLAARTNYFRDAWRAHTDDLSLDATLATFVEDLRSRGRITGDAPPSRELALMIIDEYIRFPPPVAA